MSNITKKAALTITADLDRLANLVSTEAKALGINPKLAAQFVQACDCVSDEVEKKAGFDPSSIGQEVAGPLTDGSVAPAVPLKGEFSQQENRELREKQQAGQVSKGSPEAQPASPGAKLAAEFTNVTRLAKAGKISRAAFERADRAMKLASEVLAKAAEEEEPEAAEEEEEKSSDKTASHGYNLYA